MAERVTPYRFAKLRGIPKQTMYSAIRRGLFTVGDDGKLDPDEAQQQWDARSQSRAIKGARTPKFRMLKPQILDSPLPTTTSATPPSDDDVKKYREWTQQATEARALKDVIDAQRAKLRLNIESGEFIHRKTVEKDAFELYRALREAFMGLPDRLAGQLAAIRDVADVHFTLDAEVRAILDAFADRIEASDEEVA